MLDAALAWRLTADRQYANQVDTYLRAWASTYVPDFDPIDETIFDSFIQAYTLVHDTLSDQTRTATQHFLHALGDGYLTRSNTAVASGLTAGTWINNWQSHRIKLIAMSAAALEDPSMLTQARALLVRQLTNNVRSDGSVLDFTERDALHYVVYDLQPLALAAVVAKPFGENWFTLPGGNNSTLTTAIDWLNPYADGSKVHDEFVHSTVKFDQERAKAGVPGFSGPWDPKTSATLYWEAASLDSKYRPLATNLGPEPTWLSLCS